MPFKIFGSAVSDDGRKTLVIPTHELINNRYHQHEVVPVLKTCADTIVNSGKVWRWNRYTGERMLVRWHDDKFIGGSIDDWREWLGQQWQIMDTAGMQWAGPSRPVMARLLEVILDHPGLPLASFELQDEMRRKARK
jgi:hypothetical protein